MQKGKENKAGRDNSHDRVIPVARVSKPFGTGEELVINLYDTFPADYDKTEPLFATVDGLSVPLFPEKFERRGRSGALVAFADIDTPERAAGFLGMELSARVEPDMEDSEGDEVYFDDMVGFTARFSGSDLTGTIVGFVDSEHNPLFTLSVQGKEVFVPATDDLIEKFNLKKREVVFALPDGLLELYL